ncbi:MAG: phosphatase PAP2 family protein [Tissierellia bacterium]|nr:phosphatase PAP2 family protein [Tissierellia bacterium]
MRTFFKKLDDTLIHWINDRWSHPVLDRFFYIYTNVASPFVLGLVAVFLFFFARPLLGREAREAAVSLILATGIAHLIKRLFGRARPYWIRENLNTFNIKMRDYSFPSGHTTAAFTLATTFSLYFPPLAWILMTLALLVGISRIYLAVHYPTDVLAGIILGFVVSIFVHKVLYLWLGQFAFFA